MLESFRKALQSPDKAKKHAAETQLSEMVTDMPQLKHTLHSMGVRFRMRFKQQGRPAGSKQVNDEAIRTALLRHSQDSAQVHEQLEVPVRTLDLSKRRAAETTKLLKKSQLAKRLRHCALGFSGASTQRGRCDACYSWQMGGRKRLQSLLLDLRETAVGILPTFFCLGC